MALQSSSFSYMFPEQILELKIIQTKQVVSFQDSKCLNVSDIKIIGKIWSSSISVQLTFRPWVGTHQI